MKKKLVYFSDGAEHSGLFLALWLICDKINMEQEVDVFHAVKQVKVSRPEFVPNKVGSICIILIVSRT